MSVLRFMSCRRKATYRISFFRSYLWIFLLTYCSCLLGNFVEEQLEKNLYLDWMYPAPCSWSLTLLHSEHRVVCWVDPRKQRSQFHDRCDCGFNLRCSSRRKANNIPSVPLDITQQLRASKKDSHWIWLEL